MLIYFLSVLCGRCCRHMCTDDWRVNSRKWWDLKEAEMKADICSFRVLKHHSWLIITRHGCFFLTRPRLSRSAYKLPPLTLAILALLGLVALMLLACLLSCIYKVHKRNEKNKKLTLIAQQAGKSDGEAFRQVTPIFSSLFLLVV